MLLGNLIHSILDYSFGITIIGLIFCVILAVYTAWLSWNKHKGSITDRPLHQQESMWLANYYQGLSTEMLGAVFTTFLLGLTVLVTDNYQDIQNLKRD